MVEVIDKGRAIAVEIAMFDRCLKDGESRRLLAWVADLLLLAVNIAVLIFSGGDGRIFFISLLTAITIRYLFLSVLIFLDGIFPGRLTGLWLRRMVKDPSEGGAYKGGGAETPVLGHWVFITIFGYIPLMMLLRAFDDIPIAEQAGMLLAAAGTAELRDILAGRVIYFRSGAGQCLNASWNFTLPLALAFTVISLTLLVLALDMIWLPVSLLTMGEPTLPFGKRGVLWLISIWVLGVFHYILMLHDRDPKSSAECREA